MTNTLTNMDSGLQGFGLMCRVVFRAVLYLLGRAQRAQPAPKPTKSGVLATGYARRSCDLQGEQSIADQCCKCRETATRMVQVILANSEFADER